MSTDARTLPVTISGTVRVRPRGLNPIAPGTTLACRVDVTLRGRRVGSTRTVRYDDLLAVFDADVEARVVAALASDASRSLRGASVAQGTAWPGPEVVRVLLDGLERA